MRVTTILAARRNKREKQDRQIYSEKCGCILGKAKIDRNPNSACKLMAARRRVAAVGDVDS